MLVNQDSAIQQPLQFLSLISISFGGLSLGEVHQVLRQEGKLIKTSPTPVYLGGNGGRLINWIDASSSFQRGDPDRLMELLQVKAAGCEQGNGSVTAGAYMMKPAVITIAGSERQLIQARLSVSGASLSINDLVFSAGERVELPHMKRSRATPYQT